MSKHFGIITVIDAFIKYNTLRGGDYVIAKDFIAAVKRINDNNKDIVIETLESGVMIMRLGGLIR